jgi:hypothetical protein|tara:strand:+ start:670 stop:894 length:225 start_codon:yes stop_codon:yes gene_type:complete
MAWGGRGAVSFSNAQQRIVGFVASEVIHGGWYLHVINCDNGIHGAAKQIPTLCAVQLKAVHATLPFVLEKLVAA